MPCYLTSFQKIYKNYMTKDMSNLVPMATGKMASSAAAKRQFFAAEDVGISFVCVQTKENSLEKFTANDAVVY